MLQDNTEDYGPEEEDYSSEAENVGNQNSLSAVSTFVTNSNNSRPLNPDCKEFKFRAPSVESQSVTSLSNSISTSTVPSDNAEEPVPPSELVKNITELSLHNSTTPEIHNSPLESPALITHIEYATEAIANETNHTNGTNGFVETQETEIGVDVTCPEFHDIVDKIEDNCPKMIHQEPTKTIVPNGTEDCDRLSNGTSNGTIESQNIEIIQRITSQETLSKNNQSRKKYKVTKLVREATPGPELDEQQPKTPEIETTQKFENVPVGVDAFQAQMSADDSGFESQSRFSDYPITEAVTQWLRRANSPDLFTSIDAANAENEEMEDDEIDEPPKNLQGNPMPALSANSNVNDMKIDLSLCLTSCGEFARANCPRESNKNNKTTTTTKRRRKKRSGNNNKKRMTIHKINNESLNCCQKQQQINNAEILQLSPTKEIVRGVCEFTEKDSNAGVRVATSSWINLNKVIKNQAQESAESSRVEGENNKNHCVDQVKTFEKGEIVVSIDGKLIPTTICKAIQLKNNEDESNREENNSIGSIEELDMLECWDEENIESVTPKELLKDQLNDDAEDESKVDPMSLELVRKYYRFARGSVQSFSSIEEGISDSIKQMEFNEDPSRSRLVSPEQVIETLCNNNRIPVIYKNEKLNNCLSIDEGLEVYESCYNGKPPIILHSDLYKSHGLHHEDGPIPCRAACCIVQ